MPLLFPFHPAEIIARIAGHGRRIARRDNHPVLDVLFADEERQAARVAEACTEMAADAAELQSEVARASADGVFTAEESARLRELAGEIERTALSGEVGGGVVS